MEHAHLLIRFENHLLANDCSPLTVYGYLRVANKFLESVSDENPFQRRHVDAYLADLKRGGSSGATQRWTYYVLSSFFGALEREWPFRKRRKFKAERSGHVPVMSEDDMIRMELTAREQANLRGSKGYLGKRNHALIRLERLLGLRRIELRNANISDYIPAAGNSPTYLRVATAKKGETVDRTLDDETARILEDWISVLRRRRSRPDKEALFIRGVRGPRLSLRGLSHVFKTIREEAGVDLPGGGFHSMRRGRVTSLHEGGMSGPMLTKEWGWGSKETVNRYIKLTKPTVEKKLMEVHPMFQKSQQNRERC